MLELYQMVLPCPSAGNMITSGVVGLDVMAPGQDVDVRLQVLSMGRQNDGYASPNGHASRSNGYGCAQVLMRRPKYGDESQSSHAS